MLKQNFGGHRSYLLVSMQFPMHERNFAKPQVKVLVGTPVKLKMIREGESQILRLSAGISVNNTLDVSI